jgi:tetratricopeptide (TPR) repeat protein
MTTKAEIGGAHAPESGAAMLTRASTERRAEFVQAVMNRAQTLFHSGQLDSADVLLETVEQEPAARSRVLHIRGVIALHRGEDERALDLLEEAIRLDPADGDAHANLGLLLSKARQHAQALAAYAAALTVQPGHPAAQFGVARALAALNLTDFAIEAFRDVLASVPDNIDAAMELASLLNGRGLDQEADGLRARHPGREELRHISHATGDKDGGENPARDQVSNVAGASPDANDVADPVIRSALRMTAVPAAVDPALADALFVEACRHHREGKRDRSKRLFEQVLALDPGHVNTLCNLGALELGLGHAARALTLSQSAVMLAPELAPARIAWADALMAGGKLEQAQAQYSRALELAPSSDAAHARYAIALHELGDLDGAMTHFLAATKISQQQSSHFYEALGRTCIARGNPQGAEISLRHALALEPRRVSAHCALGELHLALDRCADAEASFRHALAIDADHAAAACGIEHARGSAVREGIS